MSERPAPDATRDSSSPRNPIEKKFERIVTPLQAFVRNQTTSSILLLVSTVTAIAIASSDWHSRHESLIHLPLGFFLGDWRFDLTVKHWINDGLMALFFFVLGLEIKREFLAGELRDPRRLTLVLCAALGGMLAPALAYALFLAGQEGAKGWAIPMATDAAFALGALALLGNRVPRTLVTFLAAFAILDDIGAVLVIAFFYSGDLDTNALLGAAGALTALLLLNILGVRAVWPYLLGFLVLWILVLQSGIHATVAGVLAAFTVPARPKISGTEFLVRARGRLKAFSRAHTPEENVLESKEQHELVEEVASTARRASTPVRSWEHRLEVPVGLLVIPVFALVNAGVPVSPEALGSLWSRPVGTGILAGLIAGKFIGITLASFVGLRLGVGALPEGMGMRHVAGLALLAGMGFTMSLFVADLAFGDDPENLATAKLAILVASLLCAIGGMSLLAIVSRNGVRD